MSADTAGNRGPDSPAGRFGARMAARPSATSLQTRLVKKELETLHAVYESLEADQTVARAAATVVGARRRFVIGAGRSAAFALLLDVDLSLGVSQVTLIDGLIIRPMDVLTDVRATDVLIAFSMRRYRRETVQFVEQFVERGGTVVAITDSPDSPLMPFAKDAIVVSTASESVTDTATPVAAVIHLLAALTTASAKGARRRLQEREIISSEMGFYA